MVFYSVLLLLFTILFILWKFQTIKNRKLPPGPTRWPILGNLPQMLMTGSKYPYVQLTMLARKYGNVMSLGFGVHYTILISSYEAMKDLMRRSETNTERFRFQFCDHRSYNKNLGIAFSYGSVWEEQRKYTMKRLRDFGFGKTRSMEETMREEMNCLLDDIRLATESTNGIWSNDAIRFQAVAINNLWSFVSGYRFETTNEHFKRHLKLNCEVAEILGLGNILSLFPFLAVFPKWSGYEQADKMHKESQAFMKELIEDVKERRFGRVEAESFVEAYLDEIERNKNNPLSTMTEEQLILILMDFFLAGSETTSTVMDWMILYLAMYPKVQEKARLEIMKCSKDGSQLVSLTQKSKMPYIHAFILETMRHSPFGAFPPARAISEDIEYNGYTLPKGSCLLYNLYTVFHDEDFWGDHDVFRPERYFVDDVIENVLVPKKVDRVCQFGFGSRACPGEAIAMDTLYMFIITLLSNFSIEPVEGHELSFEPGNPAITVHPRPYCVKFTSLY